MTSAAARAANWAAAISPGSDFDSSGFGGGGGFGDGGGFGGGDFGGGF
ncbi:hypothetical protein SMICM304S_10402 [Streptomyces microflavus]